MKWMSKATDNAIWWLGDQHAQTELLKEQYIADTGEGAAGFFKPICFDEIACVIFLFLQIYGSCEKSTKSRQDV